MFRNAKIDDVGFIYSLEKSLFREGVRSTKSSIIRSLKSPTQTVKILEIDSTLIGTFTLFNYEKSIRIYSIGITEEYQGKGYGKLMMTHILDLADKAHKNVVLEADINNEDLIRFYLEFNFEKKQILPNYYGKGLDGIKMIRESDNQTNLIKNLVIVDKEISWLNPIKEIDIISTDEYISNEKYSNFRGRVFNLCDSYKYQSSGYYVSLLAIARESQVIPNVATIKDFKNKTVLRSITDEIDEIIQVDLNDIVFDKFSMKMYFGMTKTKKLNHVSKELYKLFETPFLEVEFQKTDKWVINRATPFSVRKIPSEDFDFVNICASKYFSSKRFTKKKLKNYVYDLAILINKEEQSTAPSNPKAMQLFKKAGEEVGFYVEYITKKDYHRINEFDALFIRETTDVNNHTYDFARYAYSEGLVVIDDPWSILKCSNKIYLYERLRKNNINMPETFIINQHQFNPNNYKNVTYPLILKKPDSAFSKGVFKVTNHKMLLDKLKELFKSSQLILAQEYVESAFDWRIGVLNNKAIYACKYYMSKGHWQIYNWHDQEEFDGLVDTLKLEDVPEKVIKAAVKAASLIGNGLYGVDLKEKDDKVYLIEVNDNPSIEHGIEDAVYGYKIYQDIMSYLFTSIDRERNITRYVSQSK